MPGVPGRHTKRGGSGEDHDDRRVLPLVIFTAVLILAVTAASFTLLDGDNTIAAADAVVLEPVANVQEDAFFGDLDLATAEDAERSLTEITERIATLNAFTGGSATTTIGLSGLQVTGSEPGLYSGFRREEVCDIAALRDALTGAGASASDGGEAGAGTESTEGSGTETTSQDGATAKVTAWANTLALESPDGVEEYVDSLTAVRLRLDTRVTNHAFRDGQAVPFQSVLQAGTAVLVDDTGVPRVKCNGGSPLNEPISLDGVTESQALDVDQVAANPDLAWERLAPERVASVVPGREPVDPLLIANIDTTDLLERPQGSNGEQDLGTGDFQATLRWDGPADLDIGVTDPNGATISAESPAPENSHGRLEQDANRQCEENMTGRESVSWPEGDAPSGEYTVKVTGHAIGAAYEADCGEDDSVEFTVTIRMFGEEDVVRTDTVADGETKEITATLGGDGAGTETQSAQ